MIKNVPPRTTSRPSSPNGDRRFKLLDVAIKRQQFRQEALIEVLHVAQRSFGYLDHEVLRFVARRLKLPPSRVFGVATFYKLFTLKPPGRHTCVVCTGTACYVHGANALLETIADTAQIQPGETTKNGEVSLVTAHCLGACGTAPVVVYDGVLLGQQTAANVREWHLELLTHEPAATS